MEWRPVPVEQFAALYEVSDEGAVRSLHVGPLGGRVLTPITCRGYLRVHLYLPGWGRRGQRTGQIHRLVAGAFLGACRTGHHVNHKDGNKANNRATNLEYVTAGENNAHAGQMGLKAHGERNGSARLSSTAVRSIYRSSDTCTALARRHGVSKTTILAIRHRRIWRRVTADVVATP